MPLRHTVMWRPLAIPWICHYIVDAYGRAAFEGGGEYRCCAWMPKVGKQFPVSPGNIVERKHLAIFTSFRIEKCAELGATELGRRVGHGLDDFFVVELRGNGR